MLWPGARVALNTQLCPWLIRSWQGSHVWSPSALLPHSVSPFVTSEVLEQP
jgi:hypothetical protein